MVFEINHNKAFEIDKNKKTVVFAIVGSVPDYNLVQPADKYFLKWLKNTEKYNVITIYSSINEYSKDNNCIYIDCVKYADNEPRISEFPKEKHAQIIETSTKNVINLFKEIISYIPACDYLFLNLVNTFLPLNHIIPKKVSEYCYSQKNAFYDYVTDLPENEKKIIDETIDEYLDEKNIFIKKKPYAFSWSKYIAAVLVTAELKKRFNFKGISFINNSMTTMQRFFEKYATDYRVYYFADDKRGSRNFTKFDLGKLLIKEHLRFIEDRKIEKTRDFIFGGNVFVNFGTRANNYYKYLHDLDGIDCDFYICKKDKHKEKFGKMYEDVVNHKYFHNALSGYEFFDRMKDFKYSIILPCFSFSDSLNFRPWEYSYDDVLPFLTEGYDPACLVYPKEIQEKLIVKNSGDIIEKIKYFNAHDDERIMLLKEIESILHAKDKKSIDEIFKNVLEF